MTVFDIHDEGAYAYADAFLSGWLSRALTEMERVLGLPEVPDTVHVFLSDRIVHEGRFTPEELEAGLNAGGEDYPDGQAPRSEVYAHGVSILTDRRLNLPSRVPDGEPAIFLDCETIGGLAREVGLEPESLLGRTAIHELSHVVRGHLTGNVARTHGFVQEGDAQRDAWAVLGAMLPDQSVCTQALAGRAAQVRLAASQPRAYAMFGYDSADRYHWLGAEPEPAVHLLRTPRNILAIAKEAIVEVPVRPVMGPLPQVGDMICLAERREDGDYLVVGPWVVLNRIKNVAFLSRKDREAVDKIEHEGGSARRLQSSMEYLVLRPSLEMRASRAVQASDLPPIGIPYVVGEFGDQFRRLESSAEMVFDEIRVEREASFDRWVRDLRADVPGIQSPAFDPDWE